MAFKIRDGLKGKEVTITVAKGPGKSRTIKLAHATKEQIALLGKLKHPAVELVQKSTAKKE